MSGHRSSWLVQADLLALFALVPPGRILYGSDAPYMDVELLIAIALRCARFIGLSADGDPGACPRPHPGDAPGVGSEALVA